MTSVDLHSGFVTIIAEAVDVLDRLNQTYPDLATDFTRETVAQWRALLARLLQNQTDPPETSSTENADLGRIARELLEHHSYEETLDMLGAKHGADLAPQGLATLVGEAAYRSALVKELRELQSNAVSFEQAARLWNDLGRPALGQQAWSGQGVAFLIE